MNKTIETAWKDGFLNRDALVAPQINDLYGRRSKQIIDKYIGRLRINYLAFAWVAAVIFLFSLVARAPLAGAVFVAALVIPAIHVRKLFLQMCGIDRASDCYHYVKSFNELIEAFLKSNVLVFRFSVPVALVALGEIVVSAGVGATGDIVGDIVRVQMYALAAAGFIFAGPISRFDVRSLSGHIFDRLQEMQSDMEELNTASSE